ncbi:type II toxin-antitoxin system VapC family toxin [Mesorhizobium opportunistum]|uniref:Ribonuclease VapC n=2 Tax=Mesorhizobium opportunistum TaxID=593909 RepID=F7YH07_MESOW|nr:MULTISPECIES: type II toxin-antitoxin system VapC family toxin [Mesorhizobium]AEH86953.1 PilT protein domain protein [Mesorhizobium opportunistum WSM2075]MCA0032533.1 type II toxin-antitoxin system VapC family toxin [Mesorhizobium sp. B263B2A]TIN91694.1 MAG: type II toxin-antitoxin system VapC family toxin [Mesorhizobium sp.]TJU94635.1 MAG: type II toxin-antitoxin system VapC family toxin [Mesorhizobium sp.]TJV13746.1 MAG: type II toxin-antitoxin system VapC family toxin [Mesorhizobium sp.]
MIIDSSVLVAILRLEPAYERFVLAITQANRRLLPAPTFLETTMVLAGGRQDEILDRLDSFLHTASIETVPFTADHAAVARQAFLRYGKGRHPAALNFGDCIAYATARLEAMPLLFKGDDFRLTDIEPAV